VLSVVGGWAAAPEFWGGRNHFEHFLAPALPSRPKGFLVINPGPSLTAAVNAFREMTQQILWEMAGIAVAAAAIGFLVAWWFYISRPQTPERLAESFHAPYRVLLNKYYVDELYDLLFVRPMNWISTHILWQVVDAGAIDGSVNGIAHVARRFGDRLRHMQSGNTRSYAAWVLVGAALFTILLLWKVR